MLITPHVDRLGMVINRSAIRCFRLWLGFSIPLRIKCADQICFRCYFIDFFTSSFGDDPLCHTKLVSGHGVGGYHWNCIGFEYRPFKATLSTNEVVASFIGLDANHIVGTSRTMDERFPDLPFGITKAVCSSLDSISCCPSSHPKRG